MKLSEIYSFLNSLSPFELAEGWDNSGLIVGDMGATIETVYLSLEPTFEVVSAIGEGSLLVTHHPLIFSVSGLIRHVGEVLFFRLVRLGIHNR